MWRNSCATCFCLTKSCTSLGKTACWQVTALLFSHEWLFWFSFNSKRLFLIKFCVNNVFPCNGKVALFHAHSSPSKHKEISLMGYVNFKHNKNIIRYLSQMYALCPLSPTVEKNLMTSMLFLSLRKILSVEFCGSSRSSADFFPSTLKTLYGHFHEELVRCRE